MAEKQHRQTDARIKKTRTRLRRAYFAMIEQGTRTSVAAIADTAGVTRGTFYQHFADKEDFLQQIVSDSISDFLGNAIHTRQGSSDVARMNLRVALEELVRPDNGFTLLFKNINDQTFTIELTDALAAAINRYLTASAITVDDDAQFKLAEVIDVIAATIVHVFRGWVFTQPHRRNASNTEALIKQMSAAETLNEFDITNFFY